MCVDADASPPIRPVSGASVDHRELILEAADGNRFAGFEAYATEPGDVAVIVLPDVRGLFGFYQEPAESYFMAISISFHPEDGSRRSSRVRVRIPCNTVASQPGLGGTEPFDSTGFDR